MVNASLACLYGMGEAVPVDGSQDSTTIGAARLIGPGPVKTPLYPPGIPAAMVTVWEMGCAPSLKKKYTFASFRRRVFTLSAGTGESSATSRLVSTLLRAVSIAAGTACGTGGEAGAWAGGVGVGGS